MKLTAYEHWLGAENPIMSAEINRAFKTSIALTGRNYKLTMGSKSWNIHYTISRLKDDLSKKDTPNISGVAIFIEVVDDEKIIAETLSRYLSPNSVHQLMSEGERAKLRGANQKVSLLSATALNCNSLLLNHSISLDNQSFFGTISSHLHSELVLQCLCGMRSQTPRYFRN